ncbi:RDD family protein [Nocardia pseudobrasiliensis]|uniref:RDD family protein n=2 Tax=Nocardia pseudobrasiliensis TaxID=45979 RepID=A0A370I3A6_9NOCA|nr:RDD family protein [Nocardia pseudobrasiliensis]
MRAGCDVVDPLALPKLETMARITGSWLSGPNAADPGDPAPDEYPGKLLGLPESGAGSIAPMSRRIVALFVDWFIAMGIAALIVHGTGSLNTVTLLVWFAIGLLTVTFFGFTPGQFFLRMRVLRIDADAPVGFVRALVRQILLIFVVPALFTDSDSRGMHDRATGTALIRLR